MPPQTLSVGGSSHLDRQTPSVLAALRATITVPQALACILHHLHCDSLIFPQLDFNFWKVFGVQTDTKSKTEMLGSRHQDDLTIVLSYRIIYYYNA